MLFNSITYAIFLPLVFWAYYVVPVRYREVLLLISSYYFYMCWKWYYVVLILGATFLSYIAGIFIQRNKTNYRLLKKKNVLIFSILCIFGILFIFKYYGFVINSVNFLLDKVGVSEIPISLRLALPVGISFYTFQTVAYIIDVYRGRIVAETNFIHYATFISFFPQLVAGPIERAENLLPQLKKETCFDYDLAKIGLIHIAWGFFKKLAIADVISHYVDIIYKAPEDYCGMTLWLGAMLFSLQIYCDFSGYSDIAIGSANLLGIRLSTNFKSPFMADSIQDLWRRWHISLSKWFADYVYIPLGGKRVKKSRYYLNLLITFMLSGLWHGANWTFVIWGGINGIYIIVENILKNRLKRITNRSVSIIRSIFVFCAFTFSFIFFRAKSVEQSFYYIKRIMCEWGNVEQLIVDLKMLKIDIFIVLIILFSVLVLFVFDLANKDRDIIKMASEQIGHFKYCISLTILIVYTFLVYSVLGVTNASFVYFQF